MIVTENQLDMWVRGHSKNAQGLIVELVWRLVSASSPRPTERRFPLGDSVGQTGPDGVLATDYAFPPFVPEGRSYWEIGTGVDAQAKATKDYRDLTTATPEEVRKGSTFTFVTPLSGVRDWDASWKEESQVRWRRRREKKDEWKAIKVIDGTQLVDWMHQFPAVELWMADQMGLASQDIESIDVQWDLLRAIGEPPPLSPELFLLSRDEARSQLGELFDRNLSVLTFKTRHPDQVKDFVAAHIATLSDDRRLEVAGRCLIVSSLEAWNGLTAQRTPQILVADSSLGLDGTAGTKPLEKAKRGGHSVVYPSPPGGRPHPYAVDLPSPRSEQVKTTLEALGYPEERARTLAQRTAGNLGSLLRAIQDLSLMPEWAEGTAAGELAIAALLGSWDESSEADRAIVEHIAGKEYGEWIGPIRDAAQEPSSPLIHRDGLWRLTLRFEGWYALGGRVFDEHLERLQEAAVWVLGENDPKFALLPEDRLAAPILGKVLTHSSGLRQGLANTIALLGSHPDALSGCSVSKAENVAHEVVSALLNDADWVTWASLDDQLPLLGEGAPSAFMRAVDGSLSKTPSPFVELYAQEGEGLIGWNYMTGVLWALETLAWDPDHLTRASVLLAELAVEDPGGQWSNRPINSLTTIFLPWLPQTSAGIDRRLVAVETVAREVPDVGWQLLLSLLPQRHGSSTGTRRPTWRDSISEEWSGGATRRQYWDQVTSYAELAIKAATSVPRLRDLVDELDRLPSDAQTALMAKLSAASELSGSHSDLAALWEDIIALIARHRRHGSAGWALGEKELKELDELAGALTPVEPVYRYRRLFDENEFGLLESADDWETRSRRLEDRRQEALLEIHERGGVNEVRRLIDAGAAPWRVGASYGAVAPGEIDRAMLPDWLCGRTQEDASFVGGFIRGRFGKRGWEWVDDLPLRSWEDLEIGHFFAFLPFNSETWEKVAEYLKPEEGPYWTKTAVQPWQAEDGLEYAVAKLLEHGRPRAAVGCIAKMLHDGSKPDPDLMATVLLESTDSAEDPASLDRWHIKQVISALQADPEADLDQLVRVEWAYLSLLDQSENVGAMTLEQKIADDPAFFSELVRLVFRSRREEEQEEAGDNKEDQEEEGGRKRIAQNAYQLLTTWSRIPGSPNDGEIEAQSLHDWLATVKREAQETGHLEISLNLVGRNLAHAPPDPGGLWIHRAIAEVLDTRGAERMREGFRTELFNRRGVYRATAGEEERAFAADYRARADALETEGFHRLATTIRELAETYEKQAAREARIDLDLS